MSAETPACVAAVLTVGTELVEGLRPDTNAAEISRALASAGYHVREHVSVGDDIGSVTEAVARLAAAHDLVVVTGGLGPTHDDVTREAVSAALGKPLARDGELAETLRAAAARHAATVAAEQVYRQAMVLEGARVIAASAGTAPGQVVPTARGELLLLPGPPAEMRPMLAGFLASAGTGRAAPVVLSCAGTTESDAQLVAQEALALTTGVDLTVLARPALVDVVLFDRGAGGEALASAGALVRAALGPVCFADDGSTLAEVVVRALLDEDVTLALAESCTGGGAGEALTAVPGASGVFLGAVVAYSDEAKVRLLGVEPGTLRAFGAVSPEAAEEMARGARARFAADMAVSVTGIAGPEGGTPDKPVGTVCFGVTGPHGDRTETTRFTGDRAGVRARAVVYALDLARRYVRRM